MLVRDMLSYCRVPVCVCVCVTICLSVFYDGHCSKSAKLRITQTTPYDSPRAHRSSWFLLPKISVKFEQSHIQNRPRWSAKCRLGRLKSATSTNKKHWKNVGPICHCEPPHADVHNNDNNDDNDNAWLRGPLRPHRMGPITSQNGTI